MSPTADAPPATGLRSSTAPTCCSTRTTRWTGFPGARGARAGAAGDKPIFLSIGYSACHWCHVMERESFEDRDRAALMNRHFVSIKVDREERPDLDHIYMAGVVQRSPATAAGR